MSIARGSENYGGWQNTTNCDKWALNSQDSGWMIGTSFYRLI